jgi:GT2 family glycosyltransferase
VAAISSGSPPPGLRRAPSAVRASVLVVTFNHRDLVPRCLDALRATCGPADEVIVVDNASSDGTADLIASRYPWVRLVRSPRNGGYGAANNLGAGLARGEYLVFLNPDAVPLPGWLEGLLEGLDRTPGEGTSGGAGREADVLATARLLLAGDPERVDTFGNEVHISGITTSRGWGRPAGADGEPEEVAAVSGACFALRRRLFRRLGGFDARLFLYFEDTELSLRARLAGCRCVALPGARVLHDHRPGFSAAKLRLLERNRWWTLLKLFRWRTLVALAPVLAMGEVVAWGMAARSGPDHLAAKALAWADLLRWLPALPAARREVTWVRAVPDRALLRLHATRLPFAQVASGTAARAGEGLAALAFAGGRTLTYALGGR